jgi:hypothetical protein
VIKDHVRPHQLSSPLTFGMQADGWIATKLKTVIHNFDYLLKT